MSITIGPNKQVYLDTVRASIEARTDHSLRVIEAGVGAGQTAQAIARMLGPRHRLTAIDLEPRNIQQLEQRLAEDDVAVPVDYLAAGACELASVPAASIDLICSDTMLNMLGCRFTRWFAEASRLLRPGGILIFRELQPPVLPARTRRDLFLHTVLAARQLIGDAYEMVPVETVTAALADSGFRNIHVQYAAEPDELPFTLEQWYPLSRPDCPLRTELIRYFEQASACLTHGPPLSASYYVRCIKEGNAGFADRDGR